MDSLRENVKRMMAAGVPEDAIGEYVQKYSQPNQQPVMQAPEPQPDYWRGVAETGGAVAGTIIGGVGGSAVGPLGTAGGATVGGALGGGIGGQAYDIGKSLITTGQLPQPMQQAERAAWDVGLGLSVPVVTAKGLELAGKAGKAVLSPVKTSLKNAVGPVGADSVEQISRLESLGFKPEVGMLNSPEAQNLSQSLRQMPASGRVMAGIDQHNMARGAQLADNVANSLGKPMAKTEVGAAIRESAEAKLDTFFRGADVLYGRVGKFIPDRVPANSVKQLVSDTMTELESSAVSKQYMGGANKIVQAAASDIAEDGTIAKGTLQQIKRMSSAAYKKAPADLTDADRFMMRLERAADSDLNQAAIQYGGEEGAKAVERAKNWWKLGMSDKRSGKVGLVQDIEHIMKQTEDGNVYKWVTGEGKDGMSRLRRVLTTVDNDTAASIRATAFSELGRPTAGAAGAGGEGFSFSTFLTNYNKMSPEARVTLFGKASGEMQGLLEASEYMRALQKRANTSNTAAMNLWNHLTEPFARGFTNGGIVSGAFGAAKGATLGLAGRVGQLAVNNRTAQLMTDPQFVKWLASAGKSLSVSPQSAAPQIARLIQMAATAPEEMQPAYSEYLDSIGVPQRAE